MRTTSVVAVACVALALAGGAGVAGQAPQHQHEPSLTVVGGLGSISFPNSGDAKAQAAFIRGVLLLHSFEYEPAAESFRQAQEIDPGFALAYWGEAMTYNHPLWRQQNRDAALQALARLAPTPEARAAKAGTPRERGYLSAIETLYGAGSKTARDIAYMEAMARLQEQFPDDMEARAFHALAILGSRDGTRDFATYMRAAATAQPVFDANREHPGAAHYLIHSFDDPVHAVLGLPAARKYADIAPGAAHAQHMTSHIFVATGMWRDVVDANIRARDTQDAELKQRGRRANVCGHYSSWLQYGHLMLGEVREAASLMDMCHARMSEEPTEGERAYFAAMRARQILDTEDWASTSKWVWTAPGGAAGATRRLDYAFVNAFAAIRQGNTAPAKARVSETAPDGPHAKVHLQILRGLIDIAEGRVDQGLTVLQNAAAAEDAMPFEFGPPAILKPAAEVLGEELLKASRRDEALAAFRRASERTPGRLPVTRGLDRTKQGGTR